jgi:hypothetical protein
MQLTGFPGKPKARAVLDGFDVSLDVISANVKGFPGFILICTFAYRK